MDRKYNGVIKSRKQKKDRQYKGVMQKWQTEEGQTIQWGNQKP